MLAQTKTAISAKKYYLSCCEGQGFSSMEFSVKGKSCYREDQCLNTSLLYFLYYYCLTALLLPSNTQCK